MSMTREEAIELKAAVGRLMYSNNKDVRDYNALIDFIESALRPVSREKLSEFKTCDLVSELRKRDGVETHIAKPYQDVTVSVNGPAIVLVVID